MAPDYAARKHACPACGCYLGQYALVGYHVGADIEGLTEKVIRLSAELRDARMKLAKRR